MKLHTRTTLYALVLALAAPTSFLHAQTAPAAPATTEEDQPVKLEAFAVTGSNIRRLDEETTLPVTVLDKDDLASFAAPTPAELLQMLPNGGVLSLTETNVLGADARGDNTSLNLRGIGSGSTLVLVNGRRMAPHPISQSEGGVPSLAVNVNQLPVGAVERIEILRDGASAIYGADAAAGVVNTILSRDYQGYRASFRGSITEHGGADDMRFTLSGGEFFNQGRTHVLSMIDFYNRGFLGTKDRWFSKDSDIRRSYDLPPPWNGVPLVVGTSTIRDNDFDNRSSASVYGNFIRGTFDVNGNFVGSRPTTNRGITTSTTPSTSLTASSAGIFFMVPLAAGGTGFRQTTPSRNWDSVEKDYYYNLNDHRTILPRTTRVNYYGAVNHEINDKLSAFGEFAYYRAESWLTRDPAGTDGTDDFNLYVGRDNPWNPFGSRYYHTTGLANTDGTLRAIGAPSDVLIAGSTGVRPREFKPKEVNVLSQSFRGVAGLRGQAFKDFQWESAAMYSTAITRDEESWNIRHSLFQNALLRTDPSAFNPFGFNFKVVELTPGTATTRVIQIDQPYTNPDTVVAPLYDTFIREGRTELATWDAKMNGTLAEIMGVRISMAAGVEARFESYSDWRPEYHGLNPTGFLVNAPFFPAVDNDFIGLSPNNNLSSDRNIVSGFAELLFPLVRKQQKIPLFDLLEFSVAGRYERYSDFGDTFKPKYSMAWRPFNSILVRASYNESFRAPNLVQTNTSPLQRSVSGVSDPYRFTVTSIITDGSVSRTVFRVGNDQLQPELTNTKTIGFAFEVPKLKGLTITVDWWNLEQRQVIDNLTATGQLTRDQTLLDALTQAAIAGGANANTLDLGSGTPAYQGNTKVNRAVVTQADIDAFTLYNSTRAPSAHRAPVGRVLSVVDDYLNIASRELEGYDMAISYRTPKFSFGQLTLRASATYMTQFDEVADEFSETETVLAEDGRAKLRGNASLTWRLGKWSAGWLTEYYGGFMDPGGATTQAVYEALGMPEYIRVFNDIGAVVRYRWWIEETYQHNVYVEHRFGKQSNFQNNLTVRFGVSNVLDTNPSIADESRGYQGGTIGAKGRTYYMNLTKSF